MYTLWAICKDIDITSSSIMALLKLIMLLCIIHLGLPTPIKKNKLRDVDWFTEGQSAIQKLLVEKRNMGVAKNIILFIGDGMGISTSSAARLLKSQKEDRSLFETRLAWEEFPNVALSMPYMVDQFTAESAGTASCIMTGVKTNAGMIGLNHNALRSRCDTVQGNRVESILHRAHKQGKWTGIVTTDRLTGATPAAGYASTPERNWATDDGTDMGGCKDIAAQLVDDNDFIRVLLGGGRTTFMRINDTDITYPEQGKRRDNRNLIELWQKKQSEKVTAGNVRYVTNTEEFNTVDTNTVEYLMGMFEPDRMFSEVDRTNSSVNKDEEPSLADLTEKAIRILRRNKQGYFLLVEGAKIDNAHHDGNAYRALHDTLALSEAVKRAAELTDEQDTLIVVTADHSHVFTIAGYPHPDNDIFGLARTNVDGTMDELQLEMGEDGLPFLTLVYGNGPGYAYHKTNGSYSGPTQRKDLREEEAAGKTRDPNYLQDTAVPRDSETHGGEEVGVYAHGPMSHLFHGVQEQSNIGHIMMYASCVGPNKDHCHQTSKASQPLCHNSLSKPMLFVAMVILLMF